MVNQVYLSGKAFDKMNQHLFELSNQQQNPKPNSEIIRELLSLTENQIRSFERLDMGMDTLLSRRSKINSFFHDISQNVITLYKSSFELIDLYGEFYVLTERIWVTCDNIFRLFQKRALEIDMAMNEEHFSFSSQQLDKAKLLHMEYSSFQKINEFEGIEVEHNDPAFMLCTLAAQVDNSELQFLNSEYELKVVLNEEIDHLQPNKFVSKVEDKQQYTHIYKNFYLNPGKNKSDPSFCLQKYFIYFYS